MADVAQSRIQHDVHPLLRHPRPIKRDTAKAQRMLGLISDSEEKLKEIEREKALQREKSQTTKWLERPMYQHLELSDIESDKEDVKEDVKKEREVEQIYERKEKPAESDADLLDRWTNPNRPTSIAPEAIRVLVEPKSNIDTSSIKRRPRPLDCPRPTSYNAQQFLSPEWSASPATLSPNTPEERCGSSYLNNPGLARSNNSSTSSFASAPRLVHPQTWAAAPAQSRSDMQTQRPMSFHPQSSPSLGSPQLPQRPRPTSFATYHQRRRSGSKIASSRSAGLRNNSYPNFSRPQAPSVEAETVPQKHIQTDIVHPYYTDEEVGPPTPVSPVQPVQPIQDALKGFELNDDGQRVGKKPKNRWSTIPQTLGLVKKFAVRRRSSAAAQEQPTFEVKIDDSHKASLTEDNLAWYEKEVSHTPTTPQNRLSAVNLIPTPTYSPFDASPAHSESRKSKGTDPKMAPLPLPFAPWTDAPPSPAASTDRRRSSGTSSLSPTRKTTQSRLSIDNGPQVRPASLYSHRSSVVLPPSPSTASQHQHCSTFSAPVSPRTTSRHGTPLPEPTCILCKTSKPSYAFGDRRITSSCWHEPATCLQCMQAWIVNSINTRGWGRCSCPECGELMSHDDVGSFMEGARHLR